MERTFIKYCRHRIKGKLRRCRRCNREVVNPYAFIRVKNEYPTIQACLDSISPIIKRGVIAHHKLKDGEKDDGTLQIIKDFIEKNPGYKEVYYPYEVIEPNSELYHDNIYLESPRSLAAYYNFVLSFIPKGEWLIKIDCDQVYHTRKLEQIMGLLHDKNEFISIARLNLDYKDNELYCVNLDADSPISDPGDHWLIYNDNLNFRMDTGVLGKTFYAWELLEYSGKKRINTDLISVHFPFMKARRKDKYKKSVLYDIYKPSLGNRKYYCLNDKFYEKDNLLNIVKNFKINGAGCHENE